MWYLKYIENSTVVKIILMESNKNIKKNHIRK